MDQEVKLPAGFFDADRTSSKKGKNVSFQEPTPTSTGIVTESAPQLIHTTIDDEIASLDKEFLEFEKEITKSKDEEKEEKPSEVPPEDPLVAETKVLDLDITLSREEEEEITKKVYDNKLEALRKKRASFKSQNNPSKETPSKRQRTDEKETVSEASKKPKNDDTSSEDSDSGLDEDYDWRSQNI